MKVTPNATGVARLHARADAAGLAALRDSQATAQSTAPRRTGQFAANIEVVWQDGKGGLTNKLPQAGAVERGADVGGRRGPHMRGAHVIQQAGDQWPANVTRRLRDGGA